VKKEPLRPDHMDYNYMTALQCKKESDIPAHMSV